MRIGKRMLAAALTTMMTLGGSAMTFYAGNNKITMISIEIKSEIRVGGATDSSKIRVYNRTSKYSATSIQVTNDGFEWEADSVSTVDVRLEAEPGYYFSVLVKGVTVEGATMVNAKRENNTHLLLSLRLPALNEQAGDITSTGWSFETVASQSESLNVSYYEAKLYQGGVNAKLTQTSQTNSLDMVPCMTKMGCYTYKVKAVDKIKDDNRTERVDSTEVQVNNELTARDREQYDNLTSGLNEPGQEADSSTLPVGWVKDDKGWWYRNQGGPCTTND